MPSAGRLTASPTGSPHWFPVTSFALSALFRGRRLGAFCALLRLLCSVPGPRESASRPKEPRKSAKSTEGEEIEYPLRAA